MILNFLDILCAITLFLSTALGAYMGAINLLIGFIFFLLSFVCTYLLFLPIADMLNEYISNSLVLNIASLALSYLLCALFCSFVAKALKAMVSDISGGAADRIIGFICGAFRGLIITVMMFSIISISTGHTYVGAKNLLDCVENKSDTKYPSWVENAVAKRELRNLLDSGINLVGAQHLRSIKLPQALQILPDIQTSEIPDNKMKTHDVFDKIDKSFTSKPEHPMHQENSH